MSGVLASVATSGEEEPTEACVTWMCGEHLVRIIITLMIIMIMIIISLMIMMSQVWSHYTDPQTGHEVWTYYLTPGYSQVIITHHDVIITPHHVIITVIIIRLSWLPGLAA